jgi:hypothetical protein
MQYEHLKNHNILIYAVHFLNSQILCQVDLRDELIKK